MLHQMPVQSPNTFMYPYMEPVPMVYWVPYPNSISTDQPKNVDDSSTKKRKNSRWSASKSKISRCCNMLPNIIRKMLRFIHSRDAC